MSTHYSDIASALDSHLNEMALNTSWENRHFKPPTDGSLYIKQTNIPNETIQGDLGTNGTDYTIGLYQIDVIAPFGKGKSAVYTLADQVADKFKRGVTMTYNSITVRVQAVSRAPMLIDEQNAIIPITVEYETYTPARA